MKADGIEREFHYVHRLNTLYPIDYGGYTRKRVLNYWCWESFDFSIGVNKRAACILVGMYIDGIE